MWGGLNEELGAETGFRRTGLVYVTTSRADLERYASWRRRDGLPYDPWLRAHERLGGELLTTATRSMTISGTRAEWEEWTGLVFPEDGNYVVPGALVPVHFKNDRGVYVEPNIWVRHAFD